MYETDTSEIVAEISRGAERLLWMVEAQRQAGEWARFSEERPPRAAPGNGSVRATALATRERP